MYRWTLLGASGPSDSARSRLPKLLLHYFLPNADDRDVHDHPRSFWTLILRGGYEDLVPCPEPHEPWPKSVCARCSHQKGLIMGDRMRPGMLRFRPALHRHRTRTGPYGCWTLVLMGPPRRAWGFWRGGKWWPWRKYEEKFGYGMRCDE